MKKTITAHICGIVFTFEEEAFELLENYLSAVRMQLGKTADVEEILTDIESRIAELCTEQLTEINKVITVNIIEKITEQLGDPSVFGEGEATEFEETEKKLKKRFFRHPSDNMIGGVCGGIAAYTGVDSVWIRIFFIIAVVTFGFGVPLYIILWIVVPEAKTTAEKLQMQGEDINIENIKNKVINEKENVKKRWNKFNADMKDQQWSNNIERVVYKIFDVIGKVFKALFKALGGIFSFAFFFISLILILAVISLISGQNFMFFDNGDHLAWWNFDNFSSLFFTDDDYQTLFLTGCIIILLIPCAALIALGAKLLGAIKRVPKEFSISIIVAFIVGALIIINSGINIAKEYSTSNRVTSTEPLPMQSDTLVLDILNDDYFSNYVTNHQSEKFELLQIQQDELIFGYPLVDVARSADSLFHISVKKVANGFNQKEAINRAQNLDWNYQLTGNVLKAQPYFIAPLEDKWRNQRVYITIEVPINKTIKLNPLSDRVIYDIKNITNTLDGKMVNHHWQMTHAGLACIDC